MEWIKERVFNKRKNKDSLFLRFSFHTCIRATVTVKVNAETLEFEIDTAGQKSFRINSRGF